MASYGPAQVRALTCTSQRFFETPPSGFCTHPLLTPRGAMVFGGHGQQAELDAYEALMHSSSARVERLSAAQAAQRVPVLDPAQLIGAVMEDDAFDIDVDALLQAFLRAVRGHGGQVRFGSEIVSMARTGEAWTVATRDGSYRAPVVVNAAGAWADAIGALAGAAPIGLVPKRRSAMLFAPPPETAIAAWPMFMDVSQSFYVKPDAGMLLGSPCNEDPVTPHDVQAEELDIAIAIDNIERMTSLRVRRPSHVWAGLRSFVADGELVGGFDGAVSGLFWAAAQGGYGIQTAPAAGQLYAAMLLGRPLPPAIRDWGVDVAAISPARLRG
jgi:D-arginine dehydrogenase